MSIYAMLKNGIYFKKKSIFKVELTCGDKIEMHKTLLTNQKNCQFNTQLLNKTTKKTLVQPTTIEHRTISFPTKTKLQQEFVLIT